MTGPGRDQTVVNYTDTQYKHSHTCPAKCFTRASWTISPSYLTFMRMNVVLSNLWLAYLSAPVMNCGVATVVCVSANKLVMEKGRVIESARYAALARQSRSLHPSLLLLQRLVDMFRRYCNAFCLMLRQPFLGVPSIFISTLRFNLILFLFLNLT